MDHSPASRLTSGTRKMGSALCQEVWRRRALYGKAGYGICRYPHATYAAMISYFDEQVGKLIQKLKAENLYDNTLIILLPTTAPPLMAAATRRGSTAVAGSSPNMVGANASCTKAASASRPSWCGKAKSSPVRKPTISVVFKTSCLHLPKSHPSLVRPPTASVSCLPCSATKPDKGT